LSKSSKPAPLGREVTALSNLAAGISKEKLSHDEVLKIGERAVPDFARLISGSAFSNG
jgi:purine nucleoside phosphorylase